MNTTKLSTFFLLISYLLILPCAYVYLRINYSNVVSTYCEGLKSKFQDQIKLSVFDDKVFLDYRNKDQKKITEFLRLMVFYNMKIVYFRAEEGFLRIIFVPEGKMPHKVIYNENGDGSFNNVGTRCGYICSSSIKK